MFPHIIVRDTAEGMACKAARMIQATIMEHNKHKQPTVLGLATGSTPEPLYKELVRLHKEEGLDFSLVITFNLDEYLGLEPSHQQSYHHFMHHHFFDQVNIKKENIHMLDGTVAKEQIEQHVQQYEKQIQAVGGIDIQILGLGLNGHIGFNEPGSAIDSKTRLVALDQKTREANKRFFNSIGEVPTHAITMGIGTILNNSKKCFLLASGAAKAEIIATINGASQPHTSIPATALYNHKHVSVLLDKQAAAKIISPVSPQKSLLTTGGLYAFKKPQEQHNDASSYSCR